MYLPRAVLIADNRRLRWLCRERRADKRFYADEITRGSEMNGDEEWLEMETLKVCLSAVIRYHYEDDDDDNDDDDDDDDNDDDDDDDDDQ